MYAHYWDPRFIPYFNGLANRKQMLCYDWLALDGVIVPARAKSRIFSVYSEDILCSPGQSLAHHVRLCEHYSRNQTAEFKWSGSHIRVNQATRPQNV